MSEITRKQVLKALKKGAKTAIKNDGVTHTIIYDKQADAIMTLLNPKRRIYLGIGDLLSIREGKAITDAINEYLDGFHDAFVDMDLPDEGVPFYTFVMMEDKTLYQVKGLCEVRWYGDFSLRKNMVEDVKMTHLTKVPYTIVEGSVTEYGYEVDIDKEHFIPDMELIEI